MLFRNALVSSTARRLRRWMKFQGDLTRKRWLEPDRDPNGPITLFDFSNPMDAMDAVLVDETAKKGGWRISDDSVIGGASKANLQLIATLEDYRKYFRLEQNKHLGVSEDGHKGLQYDLKELEEILLAAQSRKNSQPQTQQQQQKDEEDASDNDDSDDNRKDHVSAEVDEFTPFVRWHGHIDTTVPENSKVNRSGFCAIRSPDFAFRGVDLDGRYNGLEVTCRSDGRHYALRLQVETMIPGDIFQCSLSIPPTIQPDENFDESLHPGRFDSSVFLFRHFFVTAGGKMRARQRELDTTIRIQNVGLTLMDGMSGDFQFDLVRIRAVNFNETGIHGEH